MKLILNLMEESDLESQAEEYVYNPEFWENYNVIKETPLDKKIIEELDKKASLEKQFRHR